MTSSEKEHFRVMEELEEGEIDDDEDDDDIKCLAIEPRCEHPVLLKSPFTGPSNVSSSRNNSINDNNNRAFIYGRNSQHSRNEVNFESKPSMNRNPRRSSSKFRPRREDPSGFNAASRARYSSESRNSTDSRRYLGKLSASPRPRLSDYSWKRQRLLSSIRKRSRNHKRSVVSRRHECSYEDLLAQYEDIKNKLREYEDSVSVHSIPSDDSIEIEELDKENFNSRRDVVLEDTDLRFPKVRLDKAHHSGLRESSVNSTLPTKNVSAEPQKVNEDQEMEEEQEEEVLRKIALASALKARQEKTLGAKPSQSSSDDNVTAALGDNYEEVAMELDSSASSPMRESLTSNTEVDLEEDEDILRAMLLSSLTTKQLEKPSTEPDLPSLHTSVQPSITPPHSHIMKKGSKVSAPKKPLIPPLPVHQPVVINLNDDSDSENDVQCLISEKASLHGIDDLLMKARQMSDLNSSDNLQKVPASVLELPESEFLEYKRLKAEIAKREQKKSKFIKGTDGSHPDSGTDASICGNESPIPPLTYASDFVKLRSCERLLKQHRDSVTDGETEVTKVKLQIESKSSTLKATELKIAKLKEQLVAAVKVVGIQRQNLEKLEKMCNSLESNLELRKAEIHKLEQECLSSGKKVVGNSYNLPHKLPTSSEKQKSVVTSPAGNKRKVVLSKSAKTLSVTIAKDHKPKSAADVSLEKAKLQKMEQEIAAKLEVLRRKASKTSRITKGAGQVAGSISASTILKSIKVPSSNSQILKRERKRSLKSEASSTKPEPISKKAATLNFNVTNKTNYHHNQEAVNDLNFTEQQIARAKQLQGELANTFYIPEEVAVFTFDFRSMFINEIPKTDLKLPDCSLTALNVSFNEPFQSYQSPLLHLKSYRFSPYFRTKANRCLSWSTYSHKLKPNKMLCRFDLTGTCNDDKCSWQHKKEYVLSPKEILCDIVSYSPSLAECTSGSSAECKERVENYVDKLLSSNQDRMTQDQLCVLLVGRVNEALSKVPPHFITFGDRTWHPNMEFEVSTPSVNNIEGKFRRKKHRNIRCLPDDLDPDGVLEENDIRYFDTTGRGDENFESTLAGNPKNTTLWLKFAYRKLNSVGCTHELCLDLALNVLSRGLEVNQDSSEMWLHYLSLYSKRENCSDLIQLCEQAVKFAPTYEIWWKYLKYTEGYEAKASKCHEIMAFVVQSTIEPNIKSHQILEILLYICQLYCLTGRHHHAVPVLEEALGRKIHSSSSFLSVVDHMVSTDRCLAWLCYVHVLEFQRLPCTFFNPANSGLGKLVCKDLFILPWEIGRPIRLPVSSILKLFMEALSNCVKKGQPAKVNVQVCLPLYKNLIALEIFRGRNASAIEVCEKLVKVAVLDEVWILLACVYFRIGNIAEVRRTLDKALKGSDVTPRLFCFAAMFELSQGNVKSARDWSCSSVESFFDLDEEVSIVDPQIMYSNLLGLPLPLNCHVPALKPIAPDLTRQKSYMWLNYCIFLITQDRYPEVRETFETAILRITARDDLEITWLHYLQYTLCCIVESSAKQQDFLTFVSLVERCLTSIPCKVSVPGSVHKCWINYSFFNTVVDVYAKSVDSEQQTKVYEKFLAICPTNAALCIKLLNIYLNRSEYKKAWYLCQSQLENIPSCLRLWNTSLYLAYKEKSTTEIRTLYSRATAMLPYNFSLWKDYFLFELSNGQTERAKNIVNVCQKFGISLSDLVASFENIQS